MRTRWTECACVCVEPGPRGNEGRRRLEKGAA